MRSTSAPPFAGWSGRTSCGAGPDLLRALEAMLGEPMRPGAPPRVMLTRSRAASAIMCAIATAGVSGHTPPCILPWRAAYPTAVLGRLMGRVGARDDDMLRACNAHDLANTAWACAMAGCLDGAFPAQLCSHDHAVRSGALSDFDPIHCSQILWACATADALDAPFAHEVFARIANMLLLPRQAKKFAPQSVSNILWACATAGVVRCALRRGALLPRLRPGRPRQLQAAGALQHFAGVRDVQRRCLSCRGAAGLRAACT